MTRETAVQTAERAEDYLAKKLVCLGEIFLLISLSFALSFLVSDNFVSGQTNIVTSTAADRIADPSIPGRAIANGRLSLETPPVANMPTEWPASAQSTISPEALKALGVSDAATKIVPGAGDFATAHSFGFADGSVKQGFISASNPNAGVLADGTKVAYSGNSWGVAGTTAQTAPGACGAGGCWFGGILSGNALGGGIPGALLSGAIWGGLVYIGSKYIAKMFGLTDKQANSVAMGLGAGTFVGTSLYFYGQTGINTAIPYLTTPMAALGWGIAVAAVIIILTYTKEKKEIISFTCEAWEPPTGGNRCDECNKDPLIPCSKYRCRALGQACNIVNEGSDNELCVWTNKNDVTAPVITPFEDALKPSGLIFREEGNGYKIIDPTDNKGCLQPFSRLEFGVKTNEPAQCRLDFEEKEKYDEMSFLFGDNQYDTEHAQTNFRTPDPFAAGEQDNDADAPTIHNNGLYTFFVRCRDANGNGQDMAPFSVKFCVHEGPDTTPPQIEGFSIEDNSPVQYQVDEVPIEVYTNEPAECRWSKKDQDFSTMENSMSSCSKYTRDINAELNYVCSGILTGVIDRQSNDFYFRCKDKPMAPETERFEMRESKKLTLRGTEPLTIRSAGPSGEIRGSTSSVIVNLTARTAFGENDGAASCYYAPSADGAFDVAMLGYGTASHNQPIALGAGQYTYYYKCIDLGGNIAENYTRFNVTVDSVAPIAVRVFKDGANLKIITNEEAKCFYSLDRCDYDFTTGVAFSYEDPSVGKRKAHLVEWSTDKTYYVKCEDFQGKRALPNQCTIVVKGSEL